jgi:2-aminoadipate transaminase
MAECVAAELGEAVTFHLPAGGFFLWLSFVDGVNALEIARLAREQGVLVVPGEQFFTYNHAPGPFLRLCFSYSNEQEIARGVQALAAAYRQHVQVQRR